MRRSIPALLCLAAAASALPTAASAAPNGDTRKGPKAKISLVSPMRVAVGKRIVIRGSGFASSRKGNTVVFVASQKRVAFAKPVKAGPRKLVVAVPGSVERLLAKADGAGVGSPTRLKLRVVTRRYGVLSRKRTSPIVTSALRTGAPATCGTGADFDNDLLSNSLEAQIATDPCKADTDGDGVEDGFEYESARDLNQRAVPYPGTRSFPNALDPSDAGDDYDGDGLTLAQESRAWAHASANPAPSRLQAYASDLSAPVFGGPYGSRPTFGNHTLPLNYSDGDQDTVRVRPGHPEWAVSLDENGDGRLTDNERDVDGDGLSNNDELAKLMVPAFYPNGEGCVYRYNPAIPRKFGTVEYLDWDSDGDGVWDGNDDQDNDDVANADEIRPGFMDSTDPAYALCDGQKISPLPVGNARNGERAYRHPYNPCLPYRSRSCNIYEPRG